MDFNNQHRPCFDDFGVSIFAREPAPIKSLMGNNLDNKLFSSICRCPKMGVPPNRPSHGLPN